MKHLLLAAALLCSGCLAKQLRAPTQDMPTQFELMWRSCEVDGYGFGLCTEESFRLHHRQLECLNAIARGEECRNAGM